MPPAGRLSLETGATFDGILFGAPLDNTHAWGEVVFNTCMTGYQEIASDPSYAGQIVVMTYPMIGNYGCRDDVMESDRFHCRALVIRDLSDVAGHSRAERTLDEEMRAQAVPGLVEVDTRALTRHIRSHGSVRAVVARAETMSPSEQLELCRALPTLSQQDLVAQVSQQRARTEWPESLGPEFGAPPQVVSRDAGRLRVVCLDLGIKRNQLRALTSRGVDVTVMSHDATIDKLLDQRPDGVIISNGPGDPAQLPAQVHLVQQLLSRRVPLLGICLGHQILGQAIGGTTSRLPFGHHGGNHPVKDQRTGAVYMTAQNHEFQVNGHTIDTADQSRGAGWYVSERNLNDGSVEGLRHASLPAFSVQYHPEGAPGPQDRAAVFDEFLELCGGVRSSEFRVQSSELGVQRSTFDVQRSTHGHQEEATTRAASEIVAPRNHSLLTPDASLQTMASSNPASNARPPTPASRLPTPDSPPPTTDFRLPALGSSLPTTDSPLPTPHSRLPTSVLVIGSGPVVIGQAAEFDYAGTQACRALREEGVRVVLVNSNPATIMTDDDSADAVYIEPLTVAVLERIIAAERPEGLLPTLGGQTALNLAVELEEAGVLDRYQVRVLGTSLHAIHIAEDREKFKDLLLSIGEPAPASRTVGSVAEARVLLQTMGLPLVVRPAFTLGGTGGGLCETEERFVQVVASGLAASPISQVLIERSLAGWREIEYEVMRDGAGTSITVCNMENIDPMGVHTGDSIVVAPSQTLTDREHQQLRSAALRIINALEIEGGCNVQFALAPDSHEYFVIEVNPRVSRSSALASKATGYPIARVAAKIALGKRLDEIPNAVTGRTTAAFEPALDYCVVKIPRWPFDKFPGADRRLGTQMKSTGEVMAIERTFEAAMNKALRSLEQPPPTAEEVDDPVLIRVANDRRIFAILNAIRSGHDLDHIAHESGIGRWFLCRLARIGAVEESVRTEGLTPANVRMAKRCGLSDHALARLASTPIESVREARNIQGIRPAYKSVDTCAAEFAAVTPYYYSCFETETELRAADDTPSRNVTGSTTTSQPETSPDKGLVEGMPTNEATQQLPVVVIGSGPIRIGQGIEFDYCSVQAARSLRAAGVPAVMINSNPETVSTDFDCSDRLYFEPLDVEATSAVIEAERARGVLVQFGGQTAINLAEPLARRGFMILGTSVESIDLAEDRKRFESLMRELGVEQPEGAATVDPAEAARIADRIGFPVLVRPSFVLGGRGMEIVHTRDQLAAYMREALAALPRQGGERRGTVLIDKYLLGSEVDVDAIADGATVVIPGLMEHIERAGVHSGDSMASYPPVNLGSEIQDAIVAQTIKIARALDIKGLCNIQFVVHEDRPRVLEVNPRASRTVPFISKVTGVRMVELATKVALGKKLIDLDQTDGLFPVPALYAIKASVFSTNKLQQVDSALGPEMKSTGEVMGIDADPSAAIEKAFLAALGRVPLGGAALCSIADADKAQAIPILERLRGLGFELFATSGTASALAVHGIEAIPVGRIDQSRPSVLDVIDDGAVTLVINTVSRYEGPFSNETQPQGVEAVGRSIRDGYRIREAAERHRIPCCTSLDTATALVEAISRHGSAEEYHVATITAYRRGLASAGSIPKMRAAHST